MEAKEAERRGSDDMDSRKQSRQRAARVVAAELSNELLDEVRKVAGWADDACQGDSPEADRSREQSSLAAWGSMDVLFDLLQRLNRAAREATL